MFAQSRGRQQAIRIQYDSISIGAGILCVAIAIFYITLGGAIATEGSYALLIGLGALLFTIIGGYYQQGQTLRGKKGVNEIFWIAGLLLAYIVLAQIVPVVPQFLPQALIGITNEDAQFAIRKTFGVMMAVYEEFFFRGLFGNLLLQKMGWALGTGADGTIFGLYHATVYGSSLSTIWVLIGDGMLDVFADSQTGRLSTSLVAHVANNLFFF